MLRNYLTIAWRNLWQNKVFSLVNFFGLAIGMTACFFIFLYVYAERSYDRFHVNAANLYRVPMTSTINTGYSETSAANHPAVGPTMKAEFREVINFTRLVHSAIRLNGSMVSYTDEEGHKNVFNEPRIYFADPSFLTMFSFSLLAGNPATALADGHSIVISESTAAKYFAGNGSYKPGNAIGKTVYLNGDNPFKVTGVFRDVPENSHVKFDILISFNLLGKQWGYDEWTFPEFYNYVLLAPGTDAKKLEAQLPAFVDRHMGSILKEHNFLTQFHLQRITDIHLHSNYSQEAEANGSAKELWLLSVIGLFILVIAWVNYINLSTARSLERAKEVGIRKVAGAARTQLAGQFILEAVIMNFFALVITALLVITLFPYINQLTGNKIGGAMLSAGLLTKWYFPLMVCGLIVVGACIVGAYPAWIISAYKPASVLKGRFVRSTKGILLRKSLVSLQFVLSILLIAGTITVYLQMSFMQDRALGYNKEQVLVINAPAIHDSTYPDQIKIFKTEMLKRPGVVDITGSSEVPGKSFLDRNGVRKAGQDKMHNFTTSLAMVDDRFINTFNMSMAAGRSFRESDVSPVFETPNTRVLINEVIVKSLGYRSNEDAIGQRILFTLGREDVPSEIIGVVKNYHQRSLKEAYDPILYFFPAWTNWKYYTVRFNSGNVASELAYAEKKYKEIFRENAFEYFFLDEFFNRQYISDKRFSRIFTLFTVLAILVACLGLYGLSKFFIRLRTKEIGVRKVLGASVYSILALFSKEFILLVAIASAIAIPIVYFAANRWLANFAFHVQLNWIVFLLPPLLLLIISVVTVGLQSLQTALRNPVTALRTE